MVDEEQTIHLVSYSYPPDNTPAAHRPYQLAGYLKESGAPIHLFTRHGTSVDARAFETARVAVTARSAGGMGRRVREAVAPAVRWLLEVDKALPWGVSVIPKLWWTLVRAWVREKRRPVVWATSPGVTNLYAAAAASLLTFARLHIDLRDEIDGVNERPAPLFTRMVFACAETMSVVTESLGSRVTERRSGASPVVIYNGVSSEAVAAAVSQPLGDDGWLRISYLGAVYGGERPYAQALEALRRAASRPSGRWAGIRVRFVGREDVTSLPARFASRHLRVEPHGEVGRDEALRLSAESHVNLLLVGYSSSHRRGIPLKTYDLLGVGRPVLYVGPMEADTGRLLQQYAPGAYFALDAEAAPVEVESGLREWLWRAADAPTNPLSEPSAASQARRIAGLMGLREAATEPPK